MKKIISLILTLVMLMTLAVPAICADDTASEATPIIYLRGNGEAIHYDNGSGEQAKIDIGEVLGDDSIYDVKGMAKEIVNILIPLVTKGLPEDDWDECRKAIYNAISPFFVQSISDGDGNAQMNTTISKASQDENASPKVKMNADHFSVEEYTFHYDWRRDPYDNVDALHAYVLKVLENTGKSQVSFVTRCLGGTLLNAYLQKYGNLGLVKNVMFGDTLAMGSTVLSKLFSGKIEISSQNMQRYEGQLAHCAEIGQGVGVALPEYLNEIVDTTVDLLVQTGAMDKAGDGFDKLYENLLSLLLPALMHSIGYGSTANYWACVRDEDFDEALTFMFGEEGSESRTYFAGLIKKITYYRDNVTAKLPELYTTCAEEYGIHIGTVSKYGYLNMPMTEDNDILSDSLASLEHASFGATCAKIGETLSDEYIAARIAEGNGRYISPDKQVDMTTAMFPETSWVVKNCHHGYADVVFAVADKFCNGTDYTIDSEGALPQFLMYKEGSGSWTEMTDDNCSDFEFMGVVEKNTSIKTIFAAGIRFVKAIFNLIVKLFSGEVSLGKLG